MGRSIPRRPPPCGWCRVIQHQWRADSAQFSIDSSSGVVSFVSSPNHESPADTGSNNGYDLVIRATEVGNTVVATRSVTVIVQDVGDVAPAFTSASSASFAENATGAVIPQWLCPM